MGLDVNIIIILIYCVAFLDIIHSIKFRGAFRTFLFLFGMLIITAGIENINVTFGGYRYPSGGFTLLVYKTPLWVWLGWYCILYCSNFAAHILIKNGKASFFTVGIGTKPENGIDKQFIKITIIRTAFTAYAAILIDLMMDPIGVANNWWQWLVDNIYLHGIPVANYIGWFLVIFWTVFFYEIIITWATAKEKKELITAGVWSIACVIAMLLAGLILMGFTFLFGIQGIRTGNRIPLMTLIEGVEFSDLILTAIWMLISMGIVLLTCLIPNKIPEEKPTYLWYILPSILILGFWAVMLIVGVFTSSLLVAAAIIDAIPLFFIHIYLIKKRGGLE